jgi:hypothetical protein
MEIKKFNDMKAYLIKPKRLFTSKQDTIGGGAIQGEDLGSRVGFAGPKLIKTGKDKGKYVVRYRDKQFGKREGQKGYNEGNTPPMTKEEAEKFYNERQAKLGELKGSGQKIKILEQTEQINNFVNNFFDKNINKYSARDYDKFEKNLVKEFKKAKIQSLGKGGRNILRHGLPNVGAIDSKLPFDKYNVETFLSQGENAETAYKNYFKKLFFSGKIETDENLRKGINDFLNYEISDKRKSTFNAPENMDEVIYLVADDKTGTGKFRSNIIKKYFPETMDKYIKKKGRSSDLYNQKRALIENKLGPKKLKEILGETSIEKFMRKQSNILKEIFDVSALEPGLHFNLDHAEGIAEIANMENKEDIARALKNLIGMTSARNYELGWRGYSTRRKNLVNQIKQGTDVEENLNELNKITGEAYPELKGQQAYNLKNGQLITTKDFDFKYSPEKAFGQYFTELSTKEKGAKALLEQAKPGSELVQFLTKDEQTYQNIADNLLNQLKQNKNIKPEEIESLVSSYRNDREKSLQEFGRLFCRTNSATGGRINLKEAGSPNICSPDEMLSNMEKDRALAKGTGEEANKAKARLLKGGRTVGKVLGFVVAPADIAIELAFAGPSLLRGDIQGAINATTYGFLGGGKTGMEQVGEKFGTDSTEYALYAVEKAITDSIKARGYLDDTVNRMEQLGIKKSDTGEQVPGLGGARQDFAINQLSQDFIQAMKQKTGVDKYFKKFYPLTTDQMQNTKALQNIANFSTSEQPLAGKLDPDTVEGTIKGAGGYFEKEMASRFTLPQYEENINRLKELRIGDFSPKAALGIPEYEKEQAYAGIKPYAMEYGPKAAKEFFEAQGIDTEPYLKNMQPLLYKANGGRIGFKKGLGIFEGLPGIQLGRIEKELIKKYKREDAKRSLLDIIKQSNEEANEIVKNKKLNFLKDKFQNTNVFTDDYVKLIDEEIKLNDPELFKTIKQFEANDRPALADKMRALRHPDWAEANYGEDYMSALEQGQAREINQMTDDLPDVQERTLVDDIDDMNKANIDEIMGRKKNSIGGRINLANGGRLTFAEGPEDPSKRKFLKNLGIGGGIAGGLMTGLINLMDLFKGGKKGVVATKAAESEIEKVYLDLINVVKNKGILKRLDSDLETKVGEVYEYKGVKVLEDGENIELRFETDKGAPAVVEYRKPGYEVDPETGTSQQVPGEFIYEAQETARYGPGGDVDLDFVEEVIDPIDDVTGIADEVFETYVYKSPANRVKKTNDK